MKNLKGLNKNRKTYKIINVDFITEVRTNHSTVLWWFMKLHRKSTRCRSGDSSNNSE